MKVAVAPGQHQVDLGDSATFNRIHREHGPSVLRAAHAIVKDAGAAQDISQDVFLRLWRNPAQFNPRRGPLSSYLILMARSRALDLWRTQQVARQARQRLGAGPAATNHFSQAEPSDEIGNSELDHSALVLAVRTLPPDQREAIFLTFWGDMSMADVASRCGIPCSTAKSRVRLGLEKLRLTPYVVRSR